MFGKIASFFKALGHLMGKALGMVHNLVPEEQLKAGIEFVRAAADNLADNTSRREWVVAELEAQFHIPESVARLICELAVQAVKKGIDKAADAGEAAIAG